MPTLLKGSDDEITAHRPRHATDPAEKEVIGDLADSVGNPARPLRLGRDQIGIRSQTPRGRSQGHGLVRR